MRDVVVVVTADTKPVAVDGLDILLVLTDGTADAKRYTSLDAVEKDHAKGTVAYKKVAALFDQGKSRPTPAKLIREIKIVGLGELEGAELVEAIKTYQKKDDDWYTFLTDRTDDASIKALAEFAENSEPLEAELASGVEDHRKFYVAQTENKELSVMRARAAVIYTENAAENADAAWLGAAGAWYPQYVTWKFKMPAGISVPPLTEEEKNVLEENNLNYVTDEYKRNYVKEGVCTDGDYIDSVLGKDWIAKDMRNRIYDVFCENSNVDYTNAGFTLIGAAVLKALDEATKHGIIATDGKDKNGIYSVQIPSEDDATEEERRNRQMPPIIWEAQITGAVHGAKTKGRLVVAL